MTGRGEGSDALALRLVLIGATVAAMALGIVSLAGSARERRPEPPPPEPVRAASVRPARPIDAEAQVFRMRPDALAAGASSERRAIAHPRTLTTFRALRAFPGAPPRIPHGLTADEALGTRCAACHERGGFSARFGSYAPVTPHPELRDCLQCHVGDAAVIGITLPDERPDAQCRQCHTPGAARPLPPIDWQPATWPAVDRRELRGAPPPIPHDLQMRGTCVACHAGPSAVQEIRTLHPERADCRQCHLLDADRAWLGAHTTSTAAQPRGGS